MLSGVTFRAHHNEVVTPRTLVYPKILDSHCKLQHTYSIVDDGCIQFEEPCEISESNWQLIDAGSI
jgi:hypothetical protein